MRNPRTTLRGIVSAHMERCVSKERVRGTELQKHAMRQQPKAVKKLP